MGIYTNYTGGSVSSNYTDVQPFVGENFNYHELGIMAAAEITSNHNSFMKSIALSELAAVEQTGSTDVLYESVNIKGIFEKIKMFFKKIIEKIHKIFHTFIAKMSSWFGNNASFAKTYEKEVVKGWANVKNDWEFKGYKFTNINPNIEQADKMKVDLTDAAEKIKNTLSSGDIVTLCKAASITDSEEGLKQVREHMDDIKESMRKNQIDNLKKNLFSTSVSASYSGGGLDSSEFTEELFKLFRNDQDSKKDISKDKILESYGGSISGMMTYIKEFDKIKSKTEAAERKLVKGINDLIKKVDKAQNDLINENKTKSEDEKKTNEIAVQASSVFQTLYSSLSELTTQSFSALLQAQKDACVQAKEIAVKVIGQSKKITEESYDYSSSNNGFDFISSVKLI